MSGSRLAGRVALLTGASRGIGAAAARAYVAEGAAVAIGYEPRPASAEQAAKLVAEISAAGGRAIAVAGGMADPDDIESFAANVRAELGPADIVVNNAAASARSPWTQLRIDEWDQVQNVNLRGAWLMARAAYPDLRASEHASIINVTSVMVETGQPGALHYTASKAGLIGLTRALARELGEEGIRVNAVMPGAIRTEHEREMEPDGSAIFTSITGRQALKRRGRATDLAGAFVFLASDESGFVTGQVLNVDGGWVHY
jgi:3-oxoacyl-[acyl-carrier protein] reductase